MIFFKVSKKASSPLITILLFLVCGFSDSECFAQCANLAPYQPFGWDNKLVLSTITGTNTSASTFLSSDLIYLDWAVVNSGNCNITNGFSNSVYVDGVLTAYSAAGLNSSTFTYKEDIPLGHLSPGSHTIQIFADSYQNVSETNESDNSYSRTINVTSCVNLAPYHPATWDDNLVISNVAGTTNSATTFYENQTLYLDFAVVNNGSCNTNQTFSNSVYVDGVLTVYNAPSLNSNNYSAATDITIGPLSTGSHTIQLFVDSYGVIGETNESDNSYSRTINVVSAACANLTPYQPAGWDDKIVLSTESGTSSSSGIFYNSQTIYVDWAAINNGSCTITDNFASKLYVDGVLVNTYGGSNVGSNVYAYATDFAIGPLSAGQHSIQIVADANGNVNETNESDNSYSRTFTVTAACANLTPYQPNAWDDKLVLSTITGTTTSASTFLSTQAIYLDYAVVNNGSCSIAQFFSISIYVDGVLTAYNVPGLNNGTFTYGSDIVIGSLSAGTHTIQLFADSYNTVPESNESDNSYSRTITVTAPACVNLIPYQPSSFDDKLVISTSAGSNTSSASFADNQNIYLDFAVKNSGSCTNTQTFSTKVFVDGVFKTETNHSVINSGDYSFINDLNIGTLPVGNHSIQIVVDGSSLITETDESDNSYSRSIQVVSGACVNLTPYQPSGWDNALVLSTVPNTNTSAGSIMNSQTIYLDWAVLNSGSCNITQAYITKIYVDNTLTGTYTTSALTSGNWAGFTDIQLGPIAGGAHTIQIKTDADANISESNELDNTYTRAFNVTFAPCVTATVNTIFNGSKTIVTDNFTQPGNYIMNDNCQAATIHVMDWNSSTLTANPLEITSPTNTWTSQNQQFAASSSWAIKQAYNYFLNVHGRNSYDNLNGVVNAYINSVFDAGGGILTTDNSAMSTYGGNMKIGLGSSNTLANSWSTLDILSHEYTHAVTGGSSGLQYQNEPGALNESFSDIFGEVIENYATGSNDWLFGANRTSGPVRSLSDPKAYGAPDTYLRTNWWTGTGDNGGVHVNSGVQNKWFYLLSQGGSGTNDNGYAYTITGIGLVKARAIAYRNLTTYLLSISDYPGARAGSIQAAEDLYGFGSVEAEAVKNCWCAVGVGNCAAPCVTPTAVTVSGGGTYCSGVVYLNASGGAFGTMYFQGTTSNGQSTDNPATQWGVVASGTYYFRAQNSCGIWGPEGSATVVRNNGPNNWTGAVSSAWENTANWSCNSLPDANTNVVITNGPVVVNSNAVCKTLTVSPGVSFTVKAGYSVKVMQ